MTTATIHTWYDFMDGGRYPLLTTEQSKPINHSCETGFELTITVPDGYRLGENESGNILLVPIDGGENILLVFGVQENTIVDYWTHMPIKGVKIIEKIEY